MGNIGSKRFLRPWKPQLSLGNFLSSLLNFNRLLAVIFPFKKLKFVLSFLQLKLTQNDPFLRNPNLQGLCSTNSHCTYSLGHIKIKLAFRQCPIFKQICPGRFFCWTPCRDDFPVEYQRGRDYPNYVNKRYYSY